MKVVSLFSGAGGLDLGFKMAGHNIVWANDLYDDAVETYRTNLGSHIVCKDIFAVDENDVPDCDIIIGGFPCQGFSVANTKRNINDERNQLYKQLMRVINAKQPKFFLAENVKGIFSLAKGEEEKKSYDRFKGSYVNGGAFVRRMFKSDWRRGPLGDGGSYYSIEKITGDYKAEVHFGEIDDFCVGNEFDASIELSELWFTLITGKKELAAWRGAAGAVQRNRVHRGKRPLRNCRKG